MKYSTIFPAESAKNEAKSRSLRRGRSGTGMEVERNIKNVMGNRVYILRFRKSDQEIFKAIKTGRKKVETRAATPRYKKIQIGDKIKFICGKESFQKTVKQEEVYKTISALVKKYQPKEINPRTSSQKELEDMYYRFPDYRKKIRKYGLIIWKFK